MRAASSGVGLPSSTWRDPPLQSTRLKLWLPPKVWLQGSQSSTTGGRSRRKGHATWMAAWLEQIMRWVLMTPLGTPVEPEVKSTLATVSGVCSVKCASSASPGSLCRSASSGSTAPVAPRLATSVAPEGASAVSARA